MIDIIPEIPQERAVISLRHPEQADRDQICEYLARLVDLIGMSLAAPAEVSEGTPGNGGRDGWALKCLPREAIGLAYLTTSSIVFHSYDFPDGGHASTVDIYSCQGFDIYQATDFTQEFWDAKPGEITAWRPMRPLAGQPAQLTGNSLPGLQGLAVKEPAQHDSGHQHRYSYGDHRMAPAL
jgi:hypothetical protein